MLRSRAPSGRWSNRNPDSLAVLAELASCVTEYALYLLLRYCWLVNVITVESVWLMVSKASYFWKSICKMIVYISGHHMWSLDCRRTASKHKSAPRVEYLSRLRALDRTRKYSTVRIYLSKGACHQKPLNRTRSVVWSQLWIRHIVHASRVLNVMIAPARCASSVKRFIPP